MHFHNDFWLSKAHAVLVITFHVVLAFSFCSCIFNNVEIKIKIKIESKIDIKIRLKIEFKIEIKEKIWNEIWIENKVLVSTPRWVRPQFTNVDIFGHRCLRYFTESKKIG